MERELRQTSAERFLGVTHQAAKIAASADLSDLLERTLDLFVEVAGAEAGTLYLYDKSRDQLIFRVVKGDSSSRSLLNRRISSQQGIAGAALRSGAPIFVDDVDNDPRWDRTVGELAKLRLHTMYCLPLSTEQGPVGVVQVFNLPARSLDDEDEVELLQFLGNIKASAIEKQRLFDDIQQREKRQRALMDIQLRLSTTLDREELLTRIMDYARELLGVEATSIWELDEQHDVLVAAVATGTRSNRLKEMTLPIGEGIIGHVVATGERVVVDDVSKDDRHSHLVDLQSGFVTRSILCVPLRAPRILLGPERGEIESSVIGGAQALNKRDGSHFTEEDFELFELFANQAATALQLARLYGETYKLMMGMIKALAGAVDARDRNNQQHSQRVSDFAVAIAEELGLPREQIYHVRIGSLLHDIGKIGIPDAILDKPGHLTADERREMDSHPVKGYEIMSQEELRWLLRAELPALIEHHEKLNGQGYPRQLSGDNISQIARIVSVADVFDALTSSRPYRAPWPAEQAIDYLYERIGTEFDERCVEALRRARENGKIATQEERVIS